MKPRIALVTLLLLLFLAPAARAVQTKVSVATPAGPPLENATIQIFNTEGQIVAEEETDEEGSVIFDLPIGDYTAETVDGEHAIDLTAGETARLTIPEIYGILTDIDALTRYFREFGGSAAEYERALELVDDDIAEQVRTHVDEAGGVGSASDRANSAEDAAAEPGSAQDARTEAGSAEGTDAEAAGETPTGDRQGGATTEGEPGADPAGSSGRDVATDDVAGAEGPPSGDPAGSTGSETGSTGEIDSPPDIPSDSSDTDTGGVAGAEDEGDEIGVGEDLTSRIPDIDYELRPADVEEEEEEDDDEYEETDEGHQGGTEINVGGGDVTWLNPPGSGGGTNDAVQRMTIEISIDGAALEIPAGSTAWAPLAAPDRLSHQPATSDRGALNTRLLLGSPTIEDISAHVRPVHLINTISIGIGTPDPLPARDDSPSGSQPPLQILLTNNGSSTGEAFTAKIFNPSSSPVRLTGGSLVVEALKDKAGQKVQKELAKLVGPHMPKLPSLSLDAYCLEFLRLPPSAGTIFRVAQSQIQEQFKQSRAILKASRELYNAGQLHPDIAPEEYFHSIRQWALWTDEQGFDSKSFADAFIKHTRKNLEAAGGKWNKQYEQVLRGALGGRWNDIQSILRAAGRH